MRTHLLSQTFIVLALASSPLMAADQGATQDAAPSQTEAMPLTPEEAALLENMAAEEAAMAEEEGANAGTATEEMTTDKATATGEMPADEPPSAEEMTTDEAPAAEEKTADEATAAEEMPTDEATAAEEMPAKESAESTTVTTGTVIERRGPAAPVPNIDMPTRGMSMSKVEKRYGKPQSVEPPVGDPPITRWIYPGYTVYFEYKFVIQSVPNS